MVVSHIFLYSSDESTVSPSRAKLDFTAESSKIATIYARIIAMQPERDEAPFAWSPETEKGEIGKICGKPA